jgi:hypothetical protein
MARKPPRLNTAASICKAVAKYDLNAHIVVRPDGSVEIDITSKTAAPAAKPAANGKLIELDAGIGTDVADAIAAL